MMVVDYLMVIYGNKVVFPLQSFTTADFTIILQIMQEDITVTVNTLS
jgi:hypothetical protein